ncbi:Translation initiation factor IF-2 [Leucoagaricus sp. SymC.cos]|nr:Translation initiation factor IF-2 [Leucoagaricus sp. SymC.cos]
MDVYIPTTITVGTLARILDVKFDRLIRKMVEAGMVEEATHGHVLTSDYAILLAEELGRNPIVDDEAAFDIYPPPPHPDPSSLPSRPPIVTVMGHVDHGKTTLLDTLRSSAVAKGEAGGITQHIGAFSVPVKSSQGQQSITFLDTPGHAAFSAMRARGASVTDIVVLVVAADDGIMPQTKEVINLLQKDTGKVSLVVAINKVDKPEANVEAVELALMSEGIQLESLGGDVPSVEVSGLTGQGLPDLVETLSAMAELQDLRAEADGPVHGYLLESKVTKGLGPVATVLVTRGCLKVGSHLLSSTHHAKVRVMTDSAGKIVKTARPGMAVTVSGWKTLAKAGDDVLNGEESDVKRALANRVRQSEIAASLADVDAINAVRKEERERKQAEALSLNQATSTLPKLHGPKELKLIIKADVSGSAEAVEGALQGIGNKEAKAKIVSSNVGDVTESDVLMAKAVDATIVAFSVTVPRSVEILATQNAVPVAKSSIIYRLMEDVQQRVIALLPTIKETKVTGEASVLQLFDIQLKAKQMKKIAGCRVVNGIIEKAKFARIVRNGSVVHEGSLDTMRILKKDVTEVRKGSECGLSFLDFADLREGDLIQMYQTIEKPGVL